MQAIFIRNILSAASCSTTTLLSLVEQQPPPTKSLLSTLFVQPCHSLADPPSGCMNGWGRSIHWPCVSTHCPYCKQQRPVCSADCITTPLTSSSIGLRALMQLCNTSPDTVSRGYGGRRMNELDVTIHGFVILPLLYRTKDAYIDTRRGRDT